MVFASTANKKNLFIQIKPKLMEKIYKGQVNHLRISFINDIKLMFIKPDGGDTAIEFNHAFSIWQTEDNTYDDESHKVLYTITGLKVENGNVFLLGEDANYNPIDDMELEEIWDLYELAHILDALTAGHYKVLETTEE